MGGCAEDGSGRERSGGERAGRTGPERIEDGVGGAGAGRTGPEHIEDGLGAESRDAGSVEPRSGDTGSRDAEFMDAESREADARTERTSRVTRLHAEITAATREFLRAVLECDRHRDWEAAGFGSCAEWLCWLLGIQRNAANERVRVAKALEHLPLTSESMAHGEISFTKVKELTRVATPESETELLELARAGSAANLRRVVRAWKALDRSEELTAERIRHASRRLSVVSDDDGMYVVRGRLTPEVGHVLMRAIDAASDALFAEEQKRRAAKEEAAASGSDPLASSADDLDSSDARYIPPECEGAEDRREAARRRADAIGLLAERALAAGLSGDEAPISGSRAERYQVVLHVEAETLTETEEPGRSELEDGTRVSAETARRLACDAGLVLIAHGPGGEILDVGRKQRTVPGAIRRALEARDRGCRFPGCGLRFTDAHHIQHWADGGETKLSNLALLCDRHHRRVHEGGYRVASDLNGQIVFFTPDGRAFADAPPTHRLESAGADALIRRNRQRGLEVSRRGGMPRWSHDDYIPWQIQTAAWEALDPWHEPEVSEDTGEAGRAGEAGKTGEAGRTGQTGRPGEAERSREAERTGKAERNGEEAA